MGIGWHHVNVGFIFGAGPCVQRSQGWQRALEFIELESQFLCGYWESNLGAEDNSRIRSVLPPLDWVPGIEFKSFS